MRLRTPCLAALLAVGSMLISRPLAAQRGDDEIDQPEVRKVDLKGVRAVEKDELRESIATQESGCRSILVSFLCAIHKWNAVYEREYLDRSEFRKDVLRIKVFYWKRGFREAQVDTAVVPPEGARVEVRFAITEGPPTLVQRRAVLIKMAVGRMRASSLALIRC